VRRKQLIYLAAVSLRVSTGRIDNLPVLDRGRNVDRAASFARDDETWASREYLDWLPNPEEVFSRKQDGIYGPMCICLERSVTPGKI
jgi:hypothetical protein